MEIGRKIALAVDSQWYRTIEGHKFLKGSQLTDHPSDVLVGTLVMYDDPNGLWIKPDERFSEFSKGSLFVPWRFVISAVLLGKDEEKLIGFSKP
jgi:hypothetical protein